MINYRVVVVVIHYHRFNDIKVITYSCVATFAGI
jgi:hypothetical protein